MPPPTAEPNAYLEAFEHLTHEEGSRVPTLIRARLLHVQIETIHPVLNANGGIERLS